MTEGDVFLEFMENFGEIDDGQDLNITKAQWNDYYAAISTKVENDEDFVELMRATWKLDESGMVDSAVKVNLQQIDEETKE